MKHRRVLESTVSTLCALLFIGALATSPAWSQQGPPPPPTSQLPSHPAQAAPAPPPPANAPAPHTPPPPPPNAGPQRISPGMPPPPGENFPQMATPTPQAVNTPGPQSKMPAHIALTGNAALVNGEPITNTALATEFLKDGGQPTLQELIDRTLIEQAAKKAHVSVTEAEVDARLKEAKQQVLSQVWMRSPGMTWAQFLTSQSRSEYYVRQNIRTRLLLEKLVAQSLPPVSLAGKMHLYHILLLTIAMPNHPTPHTDADALAQIQKIRADIVSGKITFQEAAKKYSEDAGTAAKGGDLGWVGPTDPMDPDFMKGAEALKEGQISDPIKSRYGYHLILLARTGDHATPAEIKAATADQQQQRVGQQLGVYLAQLHTNAKIQNLLLPGVPLPKTPTPQPVGLGGPRRLPMAPARPPAPRH